MAISCAWQFARTAHAMPALALTAALALAGCAGGNGAGELTTQAVAPDQAATAAAPTAIPSGKTRLVLSRPSGLLYAGTSATVKINGEKVADLYGGSKQTVDIAPGKATITVDAWSYPGSWTEDLTAAAGVAYEIEVAPRDDSVATAVLFGAIGGAIEAQNNPKSGLFQWKVTAQSAPQVAALPAAQPTPTRTAKAAPAKAKQAAAPKPAAAKAE